MHKFYLALVSSQLGT